MSYNPLFVDVGANYSNVLQKVEANAKISGRDESAITIVGVSKRIELSRIKAALESGLKIIGEVAGTDLKKKLPDILNYNSSVEIQIVGHIQSNKVKYVVGNCHLIQSIQSEKILSLVNNFAKKHDVVYPVLLQVDFSNTIKPKGLNLKETLRMINLSETLSYVEVHGIMTISPLELENDKDNLRRFFTKTHQVFQNEIKPKIHSDKVHLSMGMSNDFDLAVQEGSTMIRVGTAIFGPRFN
ncbi:MAG: YggS family pyridoxal phosphate-dependent enzyme [Candidatus Heimdallarchaeota archaeon]|nr:YggS family pyridoxal phosphate-dependent enzyme [Candidatus Heimdallarchaeota archaeon]